MKKGKTGLPALPPLGVVVIVMGCLGLFLASGLQNKIIGWGVAISVAIAVCALTYAVSAILYTKRCSLFSIGVLILGVVFYASSVICYIFGRAPLNIVFAGRLTCSWGLVPNQASHGAGMLGLGLLFIIVAARSLIVHQERRQAEKVLEYVLLGLGTLQAVAGALGLMFR